MRLILGTKGQGKQAFVQTTFGISPTQMHDGASLPITKFNDITALYQAHLLVKRLLKQDIAPLTHLEKIVAFNPDITLIFDDLGAGIPPTDEFERSYRLTTIKLCSALARQAQEVYRVYQNIGQRMK